MPFIEIDYSKAAQTLANPNNTNPYIVATDQGNAIIEIQGELVLPTEKPKDLTAEEDERYVKINSTDSDEDYYIKFGKLEIQGKKATLFIGTTQRLLGEIVTLNPPLALMKFPKQHETKDFKVQILDVIKNKIIFTGRPLPIM